MSWSAYVDESEPDQRFGAGVYVLAAALVEQAHLEVVREAMSGLRLRGQRKLHWNSEDDQRRKLLTETIADLPALHFVVVKVDRHARSERRRRLCLMQLLPELVAAGVTEAYFEAREARQNGRDRQLLETLRSQRRISSGLRMYHQPGPSNPLLWVPDVVAGAVGAERRGDSSYVDRLSSLLTYHELP